MSLLLNTSDDGKLIEQSYNGQKSDFEVQIAIHQNCYYVLIKNKKICSAQVTVNDTKESVFSGVEYEDSGAKVVFRTIYGRTKPKPFSLMCVLDDSSSQEVFPKLSEVIKIRV